MKTQTTLFKSAGLNYNARMILDFFKNAHRYPRIPFLKDIEEFVNSRDCLLVPDGEMEIKGRDLFVRTAEYQTGRAEEKQFEAHTVYADLQYVVKGQEIMGFSIDPNPRPVTAYDPRADIRFFEPVRDISQLLVPAGQFAFFFPGELHKPGCHPGPAPSTVKKLVFKIRMS